MATINKNKFWPRKEKFSGLFSSVWSGMVFVRVEIYLGQVKNVRITVDIVAVEHSRQ